MRLLINSRCDRRCKSNSANLPAHVFAALHKAHEDGLSGMKIEKLAADHGIKISDRAAQAHRRKHLTVVDPSSGLEEGLVDPRGHNIDAPERSIRPTRQQMLETMLYDPKTTPELRFQVIKYLDEKEGGDGPLDALKARLQEPDTWIDYDAEYEESKDALDDPDAGAGGEEPS